VHPGRVASVTPQFENESVPTFWQWVGFGLSDAGSSPSSAIVVTMRWQSTLKTVAVVTLEFVVLGAICTLVACSGGSEEEGRIHVTPAEVAGVYKLQSERLELQPNGTYKLGSERLELQPNGTYVQDMLSNSQPLHHTGRWRILNHFWDGSEVLLINAAVISLETPADKRLHLGYGDLPMYAHKRSGKIALARNEVADLYYERSQ
jgi:hypothetical protein